MRRGGTISLIGVYGGMADPMPMMTMFDKQIQLRMGQANVKRWVDDILPLLDRRRPAGRRRRSPPTGCRSTQAPDGYEIFQKKEDGAVKVVLKPGMATTPGRLSRRSRVLQPSTVTTQAPRWFHEGGGRRG